IQSGAVLRSERPTRTASAALARSHPAAVQELENAYSLEFLGLSHGHSEADLHQALVRQLGRDFCFVGSEYPVQVGNRDFAIDLVFFHRGLTCLVAFELKVGRFEPEHLGKLSFYVEALDRDVKKPTSALRSASCSCRHHLFDARRGVPDDAPAQERGAASSSQS